MLSDRNLFFLKYPHTTSYIYIQIPVVVENTKKTNGKRSRREQEEPPAMTGGEDEARYIPKMHLYR